jgi:hypothetical protein
MSDGKKFQEFFQWVMARPEVQQLLQVAQQEMQYGLAEQIQSELRSYAAEVINKEDREVYIKRWAERRMNDLLQNQGPGGR